jgi:putative SOS response-associated peptidase YedK
MCGRFTLRTKLNLLLSEFAAELQEGAVWEPRYNVPPTASIPAVRLIGGKRKLGLLKWGLIPSWAKDKKIAFSTINARGDTVATKPAFRSAFKRRRCLVVADGYYEWQRDGKVKLPWLYEVNDGAPFALAGLWEVWHGPGGSDGPPLESCSLITTDANKLAAQVHDRMPVILDPVDYAAWLDPENNDTAGLQRLLEPYDHTVMSAKPVSTFVNNARNQGPECIEPRGESAVEVSEQPKSGKPKRKAK